MAQGQEVAVRTRRKGAAALRRSVRAVVDDLPEAELTRLRASVQALYSAGAWLQMLDFWNLEGSESGRGVREAIEVLHSEAMRRARRLKRI
jgi:hypothetical protein